MRRIFVLSVMLLTMVCGLWINEAHAGIVIKIRAVNPLDKEATTLVKSYLPKGIKPDDIVSVSGLASERVEPVDPQTGTPANRQIVKFDGEKQQYYIEQEIMLNPKQVMVLEVEVKDVWVIPEERIEGLRKDVNGLAGEPVSGLNRQTGKPANRQTAEALKDTIIKNLDAIAERQAQNTVAKVGVERHIQAYEENLAALKQAEADIRVLKNLIGHR